MNKIAIFASGSGSNAENLIHYFNQNLNSGQITMVLTNNDQAGVINRCKRLSVPVFVLKNKDFENQTTLLTLLKKNNIDWIVLAGFLRKVSSFLIDAFPYKIINIHPSLLPAYGGRGMYGNKVHQAVIDAKEQESGITIHFVNENYDEGAIIFQSKCSLNKSETVASLATKIHELEQKHFPSVLEQLLIKEKLEKA